MGGYLRTVTEDDMELLFEWANEQNVRKNSFSSKDISFEEHQKWFQKLLIDKNCRQYIYEYENEPTGQIRIQIIGAIAEISYSICAEKRGLGHGKVMLQLLCEEVKNALPAVQKLVGFVKPDNIASQVVFEEVGFDETCHKYELMLDQYKKMTIVEGGTGKEPCLGGVFFLTNNRNTLLLFKWLKERGKVNLYSERISLEQIKNLQPELIISYNYKYIIGSDIIDYMKGNIINLHISLLPWNRGVSPNFWSFIDNTPKGVTIHQISVKLDEGSILYQKECTFDEREETFESSYRKLNDMIVDLFQKHWEEIKNGTYCLMEQIGEGSYHSAKDLKLQIQKCPFQWRDCIADYVKKNNYNNQEE